MILRHELNCHAHIVDAKKKKKKKQWGGRKEKGLIMYLMPIHSLEI